MTGHDLHRRASEPPRLALMLLAWRVPERDREFFLGDLAEEFHARADSDGRLPAARWYWRQAIAAALTHWPSRAITLPSAHHTDSMMHSLLSDVHTAFRGLRRAPTSTLVAACTLALGIGAATAIYSVAEPVLLEPSPYPDAQQIVTVWDRERDGAESRVGYQTMMDVKRQSQTLASVGVASLWTTSVSGDGTPERLVGQRVSTGFLETLGVAPMLGRLFRPDEDRREMNRVVILSHGLWQRRFGGDSSVVGQDVLLDEMPFEVVGVLPATFEDVFAPGSEIYRPLGYDESLPYACRDCRHLLAIARVRDDASLDQARADLERVGAGLFTTYADKYAAPGFIVTPLNTWLTRSIRPVFGAITLGVGLILLLTCVNVTNVLLARAIQREGELAVMVALGAGRVRMLRLFVAEGVLVAVAGGVLGVLLAYWSLRGLQLAAPAALPRVASIGIDPAAMLFSLGLTTACGLAAALAPALFAARGDAQQALREAGRGLSARRHRVRGALVAAEVAMAVALLASTGLLVRSLHRLLREDMGFRAENLLTLDLTISGPRYPENEPVWLFQERAVEAVRALPGVVDAALTSLLPLGGNFDSWGVHRVDRPDANPGQAPSALRYGTSGDFVRTMGIRLVRGRSLTPADDRNPTPVVLINETFARRVFPGEDPLGKAVRLGGNDGPGRTIVGVVADVRHRRLDEPAEMQVYGPERQWSFADQFATMVVRTDGDPMALASKVKAAVWSVDRMVPISRVAPMPRIIATTTAVRRFAMLLFGVFAAVALLLAASGLYGVLSATVSERTREIGIRGALGASRGRILGLVVLQSVRFAVVGLACGVLLAVWGSRFLANLLYGVSAFDPLTLVAVSATLMIVAAAASALPVIRATRVDPSIALRMG